MVIFVVINTGSKMHGMRACVHVQQPQGLKSAG